MVHSIPGRWVVELEATYLKPWGDEGAVAVISSAERSREEKSGEALRAAGAGPRQLAGVATTNGRFDTPIAIPSIHLIPGRYKAPSIFFFFLFSFLYPSLSPLLPSLPLLCSLPYNSPHLTSNSFSTLS